MGNCQAVDTASLVIQYPCGKAERLYWPQAASEVMRINPGHYVALLISTTTTTTTTTTTDAATKNPVRLTRIKLLRPTDTLVLGQVYRLITTQEVNRGLWAKKCAKMKKNHTGDMVDEKNDSMSRIVSAKGSEMERNAQTNKQEGSGSGRLRTWQPSLKSISESAG